MLYSVELANQVFVYFDAAKVRTFFEFTKFSSDFLMILFYTISGHDFRNSQTCRFAHSKREFIANLKSELFFANTPTHTLYNKARDIIKQEINNSTGFCF